MRKVYIKLIALSLMLALSVSMVVAATYAWVVLTTSPEVSGLQVTIGGGNTILVAADLTKTVDGTVYHYPDTFSESLNFGQHESYAYLGTLDGLVPVSTADGVHWFLPSYYDGTDEAVKQGKVPVGEIKDVSQVIPEYDRAHANLSGADEETVAEGSYIYLDFWVVSPQTDCTLRVSVPTTANDNEGGTFLLDLPKGVSKGDGYGLEAGENHVSAMFRVGFLANTDVLVDDSMVHYLTSPGYDDEYRRLRGSYTEPGMYWGVRDADRFSIYEPNGDYHPGEPELEGIYLPTEAIALVNHVPTAVSVMDRVTVQKKSDWVRLDNGQTFLEQIFQAAITGKNLSEEEMTSYFYNTYLQGQVEHFVNKGAFVTKSAYLTGPIDLSQVAAAGATDDVYIVRLERDIPQRIRMFVWLEGQDADCVNVTRNSSLVLNLEFAGSTADESTDDTEWNNTKK